MKKEQGMLTETRVDEDLQRYYRTVESKAQVEREDIQRLLDAYRTRFDVSLVFVAEMMTDVQGALISYTSFMDGYEHFLGNIYRMDQETLGEKIRYDQDGLCECGRRFSENKSEYSILHYGIMRSCSGHGTTGEVCSVRDVSASDTDHEMEYIGTVGMVVFGRKRSWTREERTAVQKLGRVLKSVIYMERSDKISATDKEQLNRQEQALEAFFDTSDCGIIRHSADGTKFFNINRAALRILGYETKEELLEAGFDLAAASVVEEDRARLWESIRTLKKAGDSIYVDYRVRHRDGKIVEVMCRIKLLQYNGELIYQRLLLDCTAKSYQDKREWAEKENRWIDMIQALTIEYHSVCLVDLACGKAFFYRINGDRNHGLGLVFSESMEAYLQENVYAEDQEKFREAVSSRRLEEELLEKRMYCVDYRIRKGKSIQYFQMKAVRMGAWNLRHKYIAIGFRSVDEEVRSRMKQEKVMEESFEIISVLSSDYDFIALVDSKLEKMSIYKLEENIPQISDTFADKTSYREAILAYADYVCDGDRERWLDSTEPACVLRQLEDKRIYNVNVQNRTEGEAEYKQFCFTKLSEARTGYQIVLARRDITETVGKEICHRVELETALVQAERASKAKSTFLSNMSHDIRTPLNAILGYAALAVNHIDSEEHIRGYLEKIMVSGNHLLSLINDVLDMSRIESGKMHIEEKPCSLPDILRDMRSILQAEMREKQLNLRIETLDIVNEKIYCDKLRLNQVFLNLLGNAVKFTGAGGTISIRIVEKAGAPAGYAKYEFRVKDTGIGMSREFISHIFEPFERERNSTISGIQGTGLGMAITKNIIDMMNGTIEVTSEQGIGTEFVISLMFRTQPEGKQQMMIPGLKGSTALVVDDDIEICDSVAGILEQMDIHSDWTLSGREAIYRAHRAVRQGRAYSAYIIDWKIPDMNGIEVVKRIREEAGEKVPIVVLTAYDWLDIEEEASAVGVSSFCSKPPFLSELYKCLQSSMEAEGRTRPDGRRHEQQAEIRRGRILLAEDNELNREIAVELLGGAGFVVEAVENGVEAVSMVKNSKPGYYQLVLMDVQMPIMNGYEATKMIRNLTDKKLASIPILAMTANAFEEDRRAALECGMNGHMAKPINIDKMIETLDDILNENQNVTD